MTGSRHRQRGRYVVLAAALVFGALAADQARAAFPGANGRVVFRTNRDGNAEIYTMAANGSDRIDLTRNPAEDVDPRWSPDGTRIVFASNRSGNYEIYTMDARGNDVTRLTNSPADDRRPSWTADGRVLFHSGALGARVIYAMNADGSGLDALTPAGVDNSYATASPRGDRIAFSHEQDGTQRLYTMKAGSETIRLAVPGPSEAADVQANWSPRGNQLVFARFGETGVDLYVAHSDGTGLRRLTNTPNRTEVEPAWSPDGTTILFHACTNLGAPDQHCANYAMNADGSGEHEVSRLPQAPHMDEFSGDRLDSFWSPPFLTGSGPSVAQTNGRLEVTVPPSTLNDPVAGYVDLSVNSACQLQGDFDIEVGYQLLEWPAPQLVNVSLDTYDLVNGNFGDVHGMFVFDPGNGTGVSTHFPGPLNTFVPAPEPAGTLRFVRVGSTLTAYRLVAGGWSELQSTTDSASTVGVNLNVFSNAPQFSHANVKVAYDNFRVSGGTVSCPSWWDDSAPDWQAVLG
jgi:dipeptidyl aminopeptidase/acylaminoacyl peptidase